MTRWTTLGVALTAVVVLPLAAPATAPAATSCDFSSAGKLLSIDLPADNDGAQIGRSANNIIVRDGNLAIVTCTGSGGPPTVSNTDAISAFNQPGGQGNVLSIAGAKSFGPGATPEAGNDEIEIFVNLNDQSTGGVILHPGADTAGENVRFGRDGINLNATPTEDQPDVDVFLNGATIAGAAGGPGPDNLSAQGGAGTGSALTNTMVLSGGPGGADVLTGGDGDDHLLGGNAANTLLGMGGGDTLFPGPDDDTIDGGAGTDTADYSLNSDLSVSVDLAIEGPQPTGSGADSLTNVENLGGTEGPDLLRGDSGPNRLVSGLGNDLVEGRGGDDMLDTGEGDDTLDVRDGGPDTADCGPQTDSVTADPLGIDLLTGCETAIFPGPSDPGPGPGPGGGGGGDGAPLAFGPRTLVTLKLIARRIPAKGPLKVRATNSNGFRVTARLSGQTTRKVSPSRKRRIPLRAKAFSVDAHAGKTVALKLPKALRELLKRKRRLSLRLTAKVTDPAGNTRAVRKRITPRLARRP